MICSGYLMSRYRYHTQLSCRFLHRFSTEMEKKYEYSEDGVGRSNTMDEMKARRVTDLRLPHDSVVEGIIFLS
jgi:hypothetical protein